MITSPNTALKKQIPSSQSVQFPHAIQQAVPGHAEIGAIVTAAQNVGSGDTASLKRASDAVAAATKAFPRSLTGKIWRESIIMCSNGWRRKRENQKLILPK